MTWRETRPNEYIRYDVARNYLHDACQYMGGDGGLDIKCRFDHENTTTVPHWIPVNIDTETFPKDGEDVLVTDEDGDYYVAWRSKGRWWEWNPYGEDIKDVRAWMPLPRYKGGEQNG